MSFEMIQGDARRIPLPDGSVDVVVTSPPYLRQRQYGTDTANEIGRASCRERVYGLV